MENAASKEPSPAQSPSKQETATSQMQRTDRRTGGAAADTEQPANRQKEESSDVACKSSPPKEQADSPVEQNH